MKATTTWTVLMLAIITAMTMKVSCNEVLDGRKVQLPSVGAVVNETSLCLDSVLGIGVCVKDLLTSLDNLQFQLGPDCCKAISGVDDHCFKPILASFPFVPNLPSFLKSFCHTVPNELAMSTH